MSLEWGYSENNGPATWAKKYPQAAGNRQSPVDIVTSLATSDTSLDAQKLTWKYIPGTAKSIVNTGYGWKVEVDGTDSDLFGGPLTDHHLLEQFHCHWACDSSQGSEHTVDGKSYAGELHLVHWNKDKYPNIGEAVGKPDGLAVLGIFFKVGRPHPELQKIVSLIPKITHKGEKVAIKDRIDPHRFLPKSFAYWTYLGSLTTPPCYESVTWIVFKEPIEVSEEQLNAFRGLKCYGATESCPCDELQGLVINNYRPPLPLGNRELRECGSA